MEVDGGLRLEVLSAILFIALTRELFESCVLLNFPEFHSITFRRQGISLLSILQLANIIEGTWQDWSV